MITCYTLYNKECSIFVSYIQKLSRYEAGLMSKTSLISEMLKFHFGNRVVYADGEEGNLVHVIFDPTTRQMTHIGVKQGRFFGKTTHLPFAAVTLSTREVAFLTVKHIDSPTVATTPGHGLQLYQTCTPAII